MAPQDDSGAGDGLNAILAAAMGLAGLGGGGPTERNSTEEHDPTREAHEPRPQGSVRGSLASAPAAQDPADDCRGRDLPASANSAASAGAPCPRASSPKKRHLRPKPKHDPRIPPQSALERDLKKAERREKARSAAVPVGEDAAAAAGALALALAARARAKQGRAPPRGSPPTKVGPLSPVASSSSGRPAASAVVIGAHNAQTRTTAAKVELPTLYPPKYHYPPPRSQARSPPEPPAATSAGEAGPEPAAPAPARAPAPPAVIGAPNSQLWLNPGDRLGPPPPPRQQSNPQQQAWSTEKDGRPAVDEGLDASEAERAGAVPCGVTASASHDAPSPPPAAKTAAGRPASLDFPRVLHSLLSDPAYSQVLAWLPHGNGFAVKDRDRFAREILPVHFAKARKYASFARRMKRWNFDRVPRGPEMGAYYNRYFKEGRPDLLPMMTYGAGKDTGGHGSDKEDDDGNGEADDKVKAPKVHVPKEMNQHMESMNAQAKPMEVDQPTGKSAAAEDGAAKKARRATHDNSQEDTAAAAALRVEHLKFQAEWAERQLKIEREREQKAQAVKEWWDAVHAQEQLPGGPRAVRKPWQRSPELPPSAGSPHREDTHSLPDVASVATSRGDEDMVSHQSLEEIDARISYLREKQRLRKRKRRKLREQGLLPPPQHDAKPGQVIPIPTFGRDGGDVKEPQWPKQPLPSASRGRSTDTAGRGSRQGPHSWGSQGNLSTMSTMSMERRRATLQAEEMLRNRRMLEARRDGTFDDVSSAMSELELLRERNRQHQQNHLNIISPPESAEHQKNLSDIERRVLSEMKYPVLPTANPRSSLYNGGRGALDPLSVSDRELRSLRNLDDSSSARMIGSNGRLRGLSHDGRMMLSSASFPSVSRHLPEQFAQGNGGRVGDYIQRNNNGMVANQAMMQKILNSSKTHEEIMMLAARDLQLGGMGGGGGRTQQQPMVTDQPLSPSSRRMRLENMQSMMNGQRHPGLPEPRRPSHTSQAEMMLRELKDQVKREVNMGAEAESDAVMYDLREEELRRHGGMRNSPGAWAA